MGAVFEVFPASHGRKFCLDVLDELVERVENLGFGGSSQSRSLTLPVPAA